MSRFCAATGSAIAMCGASAVVGPRNVRYHRSLMLLLWDRPILQTHARLTRRNQVFDEFRLPLAIPQPRTRDRFRHQCPLTKYAHWLLTPTPNPNLPYSLCSYPSTHQNMRELRPLRLPQLLEARGKDDANMSSPNSAASQSPTVSDLPSPSTPSFSLRGHGRFPSSSSSLASSPVVRESIDSFGSPKRPLTEVKEEPIERDGDLEMLESSEADYENDRKSNRDVQCSLLGMIDVLRPRVRPNYSCRTCNSSQRTLYCTIAYVL